MLRVNEMNKKKTIKKVLAVIAILVIFFSPFLLLVDFEKFSPFVALVWIVCIAYFIFIKGRKMVSVEMKKDERQGNKEEKE